MSGSTESQDGFSRRRFFRWASSLAAALGAAPLVSSAKALSLSPASSLASPSDGEDYYAKLGVPTIINAAGTYTTLTAACMPPEVLAAVQKSALHPVRLHDLQQKAGEYIARRLKCEGAVVTSGASGAISLATAACLQHANNISIVDMPQAIDGRKNQVIVQRAHRYEYDRAIYLCGARVTEVVTLDDYKRACGAGNAVMTNFFNAAEDEDGIAGSAQIGREEWLRVAHEYKIPCHLDAAADMPPISNLWKYTGMGFDLVAFSGGKGMRGPQNAGLSARPEGPDGPGSREQQSGRRNRPRHEGGEGANCGYGCGSRLGSYTHRRVHAGRLPEAGRSHRECDEGHPFGQDGDGGSEDRQPCSASAYTLRPGGDWRQHEPDRRRLAHRNAFD